MLRTRFWTTFVPTLLVSILLVHRTSTAQDIVQPSSPPSWRQRAIPITSDSATSATEARGKIVDSLIGLPEGMTLGSAEAANQGFSISLHPQSMEELPKSSDVVVIATFVSHETHETPSQRSLYTIARFKLDQVISDRAVSLNAGDRLPVLLLGGSAVLPSGVSVTYGIPQTEDPIVEGHRYLAFLHFKQDGQFFEIEKTWDVTTGKAVPTSAQDRERVRLGTSSVAGKTEQNLIANLK